MGYFARDKWAFGLHGLSRIGELVKVNYWAPGAEALVAIQPELIRLLRLRGLCRVDELVKVSYWAPGAEALVAIQPELI